MQAHRPPQTQHMTDTTWNDGNGAGEGHTEPSVPPHHVPTSHPSSPGKEPCAEFPSQLLILSLWIASIP